MKTKPATRYHENFTPKPPPVLIIQAPLPFPFNTPPNIRHFRGRRSGRQGPSPSAPPGKE